MTNIDHRSNNDVSSEMVVDGETSSYDGNGNGLLLLLKLPRYSAVLLDGVSQVLQSEVVADGGAGGVMGITGLDTTNGNGFHLCTVTPPHPTIKKDGSNQNSAAPPHATGLILTAAAAGEGHGEHSNSNHNHTSLMSKDDNITLLAAREFDMYTEELSPTDMSDQVHQSGDLMEAIQRRSNATVMSCLCPYALFMQTNNSTNTNSTNTSHQSHPPQAQQPCPPSHESSVSTIKQWHQQTNYISTALLHKRGLQHGSKVVPGGGGSLLVADTTDEEAVDVAVTSQPQTQTTQEPDGIALIYPPIPCLDVGKESSISMGTMMRHTGTKLFFQSMAPQERTELFVQAANSSDSDNDNDDHRSVGTTLLGRVLTQYYNHRWEELLGDIQLSFVLFLHVHCLSSLEHWYVQYVIT
jgi:hypothetical protein